MDFKDLSGIVGSKANWFVTSYQLTVVKRLVVLLKCLSVVVSSNLTFSLILSLAETLTSKVGFIEDAFISSKL